MGKEKIESLELQMKIRLKQQTDDDALALSLSLCMRAAMSMFQRGQSIDLVHSDASSSTLAQHRAIPCAPPTLGRLLVSYTESTKHGGMLPGKL